MLENQEGAMVVDDEITKALPTTPELAKQGVDAYVEVYKALPAHLQKLFLDGHWLRTCFLGTTPQKEVSYYKEILLPSDLNVLISTTHSKTDFIRFYFYSSLNDSTGKNENELALLNLRAASKVIVDNPDLFPAQALGNPAEWLLNNLSEWAQVKSNITQKRYGLLSGIPPWAVKKYEIFHDLGGKVNIQGEDSGNIMGAKKAGGNNTISYTGFDEEKDQGYLQEMEKLYKESGIDDIAERLRTS